MEIQKDIAFKIERNLLKWIKNLRDIENLADKMELEAIELENECTSKKSLLQILQEDFNYDRNDLRTFTSIQRDFSAEAYIKQLENTLEVVMNKYRGLAQNQITASSHELKTELNEQLESCDKCHCSINQQSSVIDALVKMMDEFLSDGNELTNILVEENMFLKTENAALRKIVAATNQFDIKKDNNNNKTDS